MKYYRFGIFVVCMLIFFMACCNHGYVEPSPQLSSGVTPFSGTELSVTEKATDSLSDIDYKEGELEREKIKAELMASPTPGPEPFSIFDVKKDIEEGNIVIMGHYMHELNRDIYDNEMPIKWLVLEKNEEKALLLSLYNVEVSQYIGKGTGVKLEEGIENTWNTSDVRHWLNGYFKQCAFEEHEKRCILETCVYTQDNPVYGTQGCEETRDYIFLLSIEEVQKYFQSDEERRTQIVPDVNPLDETIYIAPAYKSNTTDYYDWWLRSPGKNSTYVACVERFGEVILEGKSVFDYQVSIRPAMWVDLNKVKEVGLEMDGEE